jgi:hypothetical protein
MKLRITRRDALRASAAGSRGVAASGAAHALFEAGGGAILPAQLQSALRASVEHEASRLLTRAGLIESGATTTTARLLEGGAAKEIVSQSARAAGRQILRGVGAAAGAGAVIDGGWALVQAIGRVRRGVMTQRQAAAFVVREASTGAAATAAGATAAVLLVALTGGVAAPAIFLVGAAASVGAKVGLDRWLDGRPSPLEVQGTPAGALAEPSPSPSPIS